LEQLEIHMISDLINIKNRLLQKHKQYEMDNPDEYREGILSGIVVALQTVDQLLEDESDKMAREYGEDKR
jgi:hypothetical protein